MIHIHKGVALLAATQVSDDGSRRVSITVTPTRAGKYQVWWRTSGEHIECGRRCTFFGREAALKFARAKWQQLESWASEVAA